MEDLLHLFGSSGKLEIRSVSMVDFPSCGIFFNGFKGEGLESRVVRYLYKLTIKTINIWYDRTMKALGLDASMCQGHKYRHARQSCCTGDSKSHLSKCTANNLLIMTLITLSRLSVFCLAELIENMDKKATWDRFYTETSSRTATFKNFEWFFGFDAVRDFIMPFLQTKSHPDALLQVLDMGCGTSALGPGIYRHSPAPVQVTCADISPIAVRLMQEHVQTQAVQPHNLSSKLEFVELDCTQLQRHYRTNVMDLIVDKGTTDALLRSKEGKVKASLVLKQCLKVLRSSGSLLQFSDEDPDARLLWLETEAQEQGVMAADVGVQEVGELRGVCYYCYQVTPRPVV